MPPNLSATFENTAIRHSAQSEESQLPKRDSSPLKYRRVQHNGAYWEHLPIWIGEEIRFLTSLKMELCLIK